MNDGIFLLVSKVPYSAILNGINEVEDFKKIYMSKKIIYTDLAPKPIGPYNQAVLTNDTLYVSGQIPIDPKNGMLIQGDISSQAKQVMENLSAVLKAADMNFNQVVKVSIFLKNMDQFDLINEVYGHYFEDATAPARETVEVSRLPKDVDIEISLIAQK
jgi:2-iminobutanoate/2-iminopropanoate deaminase